MDAFDIAQLMANQNAKNPLKMRYGTVSDMGESGSLSVVPDGQTAAIPAIKCCRPTIGSRVVMLVNGTEWLAVSVIGGDYQCPYEIGDLLTTVNAEDPADRWPGTTWEAVKDRMIWATDPAGSEAPGTKGGRTIKHLHAAIGATNSDPSCLGYVATSAQWQASAVAYSVKGSVVSTSGTNHGTLIFDQDTGFSDIDIRPNYMAAHVWIRTE